MRPTQRFWNRFWLLLLVVFIALASLNGQTQPSLAQETPPAGTPGFAPEILATESELHAPSAMTFAPDGRLFIAEQDGRILIVKNGVFQNAPFVQLPVDFAYERGLLGLAFDPDFEANRHLYVAYTPKGESAYLRISRLKANPEGKFAEAGREKIIFEIAPDTVVANHIGGALAFGSDGKLYIATGDRDEPPAAQDLHSFYGKILRINTDGSIPKDNPFYDKTDEDYRAIWALGLRNPTRLLMDTKTPRMLIVEVGAKNQAVIYEAQPGANYGWPAPQNTPPVTPLFNFAAGECPMAAGSVYAPEKMNYPPEYRGRIFYADRCQGQIRMFDPAATTGTGMGNAPAYQLLVDLADLQAGIGLADLQTSPDGELYALLHNPSGLVRIRHMPTAIPQIFQQPRKATVGIGQDVTFWCRAAGAPNITYTWQRDDKPIAGQFGWKYTLKNAQPQDSGAVFQCVAANGHGQIYSDPAKLTVVNNRPPIVSIDVADGSLPYRAEVPIPFTVTATDPENGPLASGAVRWWTTYHIDGRTYSQQPITNGKKGVVDIPATGDHRLGGFYRLHVLANDTEGLTTEATLDLKPAQASFRVDSFPPNIPVFFNGFPVKGSEVIGVANLRYTMDGPSAFEINGKRYIFSHWTLDSLWPPNAEKRVMSLQPPDGGLIVAHFRQQDKRPETVGLFAKSLFHFRSTNSEGRSEGNARFGIPEDVPLMGDWDGDGIAAPGVYRITTNLFLLTNDPGNTPKHSIALAFGTKGDVPLVGDWDGDGKDSVGLYRPANQTFYLKNTLIAGRPDYVVAFGDAGDIPVAGDWDGDGKSEVGVYRPSKANFFLAKEVCQNCRPKSAQSIPFGDTAAKWVPLAGDWDGAGFSGVGLYNPETGRIQLKLDARYGNKPDYVFTILGIVDAKPFVGAWNKPKAK